MGSRLAVYDREVSTLMRTLRFVVVLAALGFAAEAVAAEAEPGGGRFAVLVGGGAGLNVGGLPVPLFEGHLGGGWRTGRWLAAGLLSYSTAEGAALLGDWSIVRREVQVLGLLVMRPFPGRAFHLHGQLGAGPAFDRLRGAGAEASASAVVYSIGAGAGWGPAALTARYETPTPPACTSASTCYVTAGGLQLVLSLTFDVAALARAAP